MVFVQAVEPLKLAGGLELPLRLLGKLDAVGQVPIAGHLPIRIPPSYPVGYGITVADVHP